ncbi:hypothetical protein [Absidia glauca]|uniref:Uncharacterized protein n=1 Tax=Absidia glauca TaxID=4829 RepID=A0A163LUV8_ABSGL|nr:hypothetical protein [Absidia glauca]
MTTPPQSITEIAQHGFIASALTAMSGTAIGTVVALFKQRPIRHYAGPITLHSFALSMAFYAARESYFYYRVNRDGAYRSPAIRSLESISADNLGILACLLVAFPFKAPLSIKLGYPTIVYHRGARYQ